jgi:hypothetical protein
MHIGIHPTLNSLLVLVMFSPYICCLNANANGASHVTAAVHSCCAREHSPAPKGSGSNDPCKNCPIMNGRNIATVQTWHFDVTPDLASPLSNLELSSVSFASMSMPLFTYGHDDDPIPISSDLFHQNCLLSL